MGGGEAVGEQADGQRPAARGAEGWVTVDRRPMRAGVELLTRSRVEPTRALDQAADGLDATARTPGAAR